MCHGIRDLIKTLFNVGGDGKDITNIAKCLTRVERETLG
jgi:hypothetical protein